MKHCTHVGISSATGAHGPVVGSGVRHHDAGLRGGDAEARVRRRVAQIAADRIAGAASLAHQRVDPAIDPDGGAAAGQDDLATGLPGVVHLVDDIGLVIAGTVKVRRARAA